MKRIFLLTLIVFALSCNNDETVLKPAVDDTDDHFNPDAATLILQGTIVGIGHTATGVASIYEDESKSFILLDPFMSQSGPDLRVYLSKDIAATEYIRIGMLKSTTGTQAYPIPEGYDPLDYEYIHIWCEKYSVEFARAELK